MDSLATETSTLTLEDPTHQTQPLEETQTRTTENVTTSTPSNDQSTVPSPDPTNPPHRSHDPTQNLKRSDPFQFGSRYLSETDDVYEFNAWDHVETDDAYKAYAEEQLMKQREAPVTEFDKKRFNQDPTKWWNKFYQHHTSNFFKDRKWLAQEFPILHDVTRPDGPNVTILEVGAGAGNTAFPIMMFNENPRLRLHACDFSKKAVELMRSDERMCGGDGTGMKGMKGMMRADVWDVASPSPPVSSKSQETEQDPSLPPGLKESSVDIILLIFIFSALSPTQWQAAIHNLYRLLKKGGRILFRDYARGDLAQIRFRKGRLMEENFYVRGDGTRVYFFEKKELEGLFSGFLPPSSSSEGKGKEEAEGTVESASSSSRGGEVRNDNQTADAQKPDDGNESETKAKEKEERTNCGERTSDGNDESKDDTVGNQDEEAIESRRTSKGGFKIVNLDVDKRLLVNRQRKLKMYRCWIQGLFVKE
ncbi:MAG: hypothetical protein M1823_003561 [Watsoniomyces obsoletus]|nr:MAG: hypothetical protein M1823_003561 [Watsoniomyces obsoletus]